MGIFDFWGSNNNEAGSLDRNDSMQSTPVLNQLVTIEYDAEDNAVLNIPRKRTRMVKWMAKLFRLPPYKQIELDELGTYTIELCDGEHTVREIVEEFAEEFDLTHREAEVSMLSYLQTLSKRGIIAFSIPDNDANAQQ